MKLGVALALLALVAAACGSAQARTPADGPLETDACVAASPPAGTPALEAAAYSQTGGVASRSDQAITASAAGQPGVLVADSGQLTLTNVSISAGGGPGVLALAGSAIRITDGSVITTGDGGNAVVAYGPASSVTLRGGSVLTLGADSPVLFSTGALSATGSKLTAVCAEAAVIDGSGSIRLTDSSLSGERSRGVMIHRSSSDDASLEVGAYTQTGGSLSALEGPLFYVTNTTAVVNLAGVDLFARSGPLLNAGAGSWGTSGANGGSVTLNATRQPMVGAIVLDRLSSAVLKLAEGSTLTGAIDTAGTAKDVTLVMDGASRWVVTADSHVGELDDASGFNGGSVLNITGGGHSVYYRSVSNPALGGRTYALAGGGTLAPE